MGVFDRSWKFFKHLHFSTDTLNSLEKLHLVIDIPCIEDASKIFDLLQHLHGVKFLTLNLELVEGFKCKKSQQIFPLTVFSYKAVKIFSTTHRSVLILDLMAQDANGDSANGIRYKNTSGKRILRDLNVASETVPELPALLPSLIQRRRRDDGDEGLEQEEQLGNGKTSCCADGGG
ncbi:hypothetical protein L1987_17427 [Smallanthus sonchifolius]|uniref:Uncharacterized protein n=1 Tax=Smallanthus sonchifolius TaxID=185202 RepID=A0ACB9IXH1_9ASTR|nr:hypothetical protein L1987_17427 [Smallanthus sonchifolius]